MTKDLFIGIENELISFDNLRSKINFDGYFNHLKNYLIHNDISIFEKSSRAIRTSQGLGYYVDGEEIEILTPPVAINKGFATRLTTLLSIGRNNLFYSTPDLIHTGYSTHWNISNISQTGSFHERFTRISAPINALFGNTPLSIGIGSRYKGHNERETDCEQRVEILADHINNIDQVNAHALFLGALTISENLRRTNFPMVSYSHEMNNKFKDFSDGRYSKVKIGVYDEEITVQDYIEGMYRFLEPILQKISTPKELKNLEDFIDEQKVLEFDKFKYYSVIRDLSLKSRGTYKPATQELVKFTDQTSGENLLPYEGMLRVPREGKLLGHYVSLNEEEHIGLAKLDWNSVQIRDYNALELSLAHDTSGVYELASQLSGKTYKGSLRGRGIDTTTRLDFWSTEREYDFHADDSAHYNSLKPIQIPLPPPELFPIDAYVHSARLFGYSLLSAGVFALANFFSNGSVIAQNKVQEYQRLYIKNQVEYVEQHRPEEVSVLQPLDSLTSSQQRTYNFLEVNTDE